MKRAALRQLITQRGLRVVTLNMPNIDMNIAGASVEMRRYTLGLLRQIVELAGELGVPGVVIGPGKSNPLYPAPRERLGGIFLRRAGRARAARPQGRDRAVGREHAIRIHPRHRGADAGARPLRQ